ncbi:MAG: FAD-dependent oxidoreductase [Solirubrobacteraceae bacterium]
MPSAWPQTPPTAAHRAAYADAVSRSYWLDTLPEHTPHSPLERRLDMDLCIVGGGYTGLWAALYAKELDPKREVVLLEATRCGGGASGRNGGFMQSSLTHAVYDYALVTEPLDERLRDAISWRGRQGLSDMGNQFHYSRLTADGRILWGGYDAVYRYGGPVGPELDDHDPTFARLSQHLFTAFPQLDGVRFTHRWGGAIDTCSRFSVFFGRALGGRVSHALGYTGLGVAASRFGGRVALDLLDGRTSETTALAMVRRRPLPFPPEPARTAVIQLTRNQLAAADRQDGRRGVWLKTLDRLGLGFDS